MYFLELFFLESHTRRVDETPSCPISINKNSVNFDAIDRSGVRPVDNPVVPKADVTSKITCIKLLSVDLPPNSCNDERVIKEATATRNIDETKTTVDLTTVSCGILLLNALTVFLPLIFDQIDRTTIAIVVVLMPPAVEEGAEPMNIIIQYWKSVADDSVLILIVANPAFLVDIELKNRAIALSPFEP